MICSACRSDIDNKNGEIYLFCTKDSCNKLYHLLCTGEKNPNKSTWVCPECCCLSKKGGDNSLTPVGASKKTRDPNITIRKKAPVCVATPKSDVSELPNLDVNKEIFLEIRSLKTEIIILKDNISKAVGLIAKYETKLDAYVHKVDTLNNKLEEGNTKSGFSVNQPCPVEHPPMPIEPRAADPARTTGSSASDIDISKSTSVVTDAIRVSASNDKLDVINAEQKEKVVQSEPKNKSDYQQWTEVRNRKSHRLTSFGGTPRPAKTSLKAAETRMECVGDEVLQRQPTRNSTPNVLRGTATPGSTLLEASERIKYLHLFYVKEGTSEDQVREHIKTICTICADDHFTVDALKSRGRYASFKIGVPFKWSERLLCPQNWAEDICIKPWRQLFRGKNERQEAS